MHFAHQTLKPGYWPGHTNNGFFKLVEALLQIQSSFFSYNMKLRGLPSLAVTVSLHYLPRQSLAKQSLAERRLLQ